MLELSLYDFKKIQSMFNEKKNNKSIHTNTVYWEHIYIYITIQYVHYTLYIVQCTVYIQCIMYSVHELRVRRVQYTMYTVQCIEYTV